MLPKCGLFLGVPECSVFTQLVFLLDGSSKAYMQMMGWRDQSSSVHSDPFICSQVSCPLTVSSSIHPFLADSKYEHKSSSK